MGLHGRMWCQWVTQRERDEDIGTRPKSFHFDDIILADDADNMHEQMSQRSLKIKF